MNALDVIATLLKTGTKAKEGYDKYAEERRAAGGTPSWDDFLGSDAYTSIASTIEDALAGLKDDDIRKSIDELRQKQKTLRKSRPLSDLGKAELKQWAGLVDAEQALVDLEVQKVGINRDFLQVLTEDVLPVLVKAVKIIAPIIAIFV